MGVKMLCHVETEDVGVLMSGTIIMYLFTETCAPPFVFPKRM